MLDRRHVLGVLAGASVGAVPMRSAAAEVGRSASDRLNEFGPEGRTIAQRVGLWDVTETNWPSSGAAPVTTAGLVAERRMMGSLLQEFIRPPSDASHAAVKRTDLLSFNRVEGRHVEPQATSGGSVGARLTYISPDGEEGYPGTLKVAVTYTLSDDGAFAIRYEAVTDKDTIFNPSSHMNFNLAGAGSPGGILDHVLTVDADRYTPLDQSQIPLGQLAPVEGTPFDFRKPTVIGARIHDKNEQLAIADGYDQNWVLNKHGDPARPQVAVRASDPKSGRKLECLTTEPGVEIYTGGFFDGSFAGTGGRYGKYAAFTLETQHFPDSPNHPDFPTTELKPGQLFDSTTIFRFGVQG